MEWESEVYSRRAGGIGQAGYIDRGQKHWNKTGRWYISLKAMDERIDLELRR